MKKYVQQIMIGSVTGNEKAARETLSAIRKAGYDGIELNGFMIKPTPFMVRALTKAAGMPTGAGGKLDWHSLVQEAGLAVASVHEDLGSIERDPSAIAEEALSFGTNYVVITGMYRFDYTDDDAVKELCQRMNLAGEKLAKDGVSLLYHNHNAEFQKLRTGGDGDYMSRNAYGLILKETDPACVNFEPDSYWMADAGIDPIDVMKRLGNRMKLYHINDRGIRNEGKPSMTPIVKQDSMELGCGNLNLDGFLAQAKANGCQDIILESHKNWVEKDPVKSLELSAEFFRRL